MIVIILSFLNFGIGKHGAECSRELIKQAKEYFIISTCKALIHNEQADTEADAHAVIIIIT